MRTSLFAQRATSAVAGCALALCSLTLPTTVMAQVRPGSAEADRQALVLYEEGSAAFSREDYSSAAARFESAYNLSPRPRILYNLGLTYDRLGIPQQAVDAYERFLAMLPNAPERVQVEERMRVLRAEAEIAQERTQNEHNPQSTQTIVTERVVVRPNTEPPHTARTVSIVLGALGLASAGGAVAIYFYGQGFYNKLLNECGQPAHVRDPSAQWCNQTAIDDLQVRATLANGLIATSVGFGVAAGVALAIDLAQPRPAASPTPARPPRAALRTGTILPTPNGATLVVGGTF